jgi:hypothetical protein
MIRYMDCVLYEENCKKEKLLADELNTTFTCETVLTREECEAKKRADSGYICTVDDVDVCF